MTYCLGIKVKQGLFALSDTRITSGTEASTAKKVFTHEDEGGSLFVMTSGLRSVRDKAMTYYTEYIEENWGNLNKMYKAVNGFGEMLRKVSAEDKFHLNSSGLHFNLHTIIGGQMKDDTEPKLYLLYPEGNWIEILEGHPFVIIGNSGYGKPILNRTITYNSSLKQCLKAGFLSFDSTRVSANDVDFPIDVLVYETNSFAIKQKRYESEDLVEISSHWDIALKKALSSIPDDWMEKFIHD